MSPENFACNDASLAPVVLKWLSLDLTEDDAGVRIFGAGMSVEAPDHQISDESNRVARA